MKKDWFFESEDDSIKCYYSYKKLLFDENSAFQNVKVYESEAYGKVLVIDDFIMLTEKDEFVYHELMGHVPIGFHPKPEKILVIGGGDGGSVREIVKHKFVKEVILCEIDELVVSASKKFFPSVASGLNDSRVSVKIADGIEYIKKHKNTFDIIIVDSTDPVGPGEVLFTQDFYQSVSNSLCQGGLMIAQTESPWSDVKMLRNIAKNITSAFSYSERIVAPIPTYPRGYWSFTMATNHTSSLSSFNYSRFDNMWQDMEYLTAGMIPGVFEIPAFFKKKLKGFERSREDALKAAV